MAARAERRRVCDPLRVPQHVPGPLTYEEASVPDTAHLMGIPLPKNRPADQIEAVWDRIANWKLVDEARMKEVRDFGIENGLCAWRVARAGAPTS